MIYGYARVSTEDQHLEAQISQLEASGCDEIFREKASGAKDNRPELLRMLEAVGKGDSVVVCKIDRIARSTANLLRIIEDLDRKGAAFKVLNINLDTGTPTGKLMLTMLGAIAEFEREMMLERQRDGIERARSEGKYNGRVPSAMRKADEVLAVLRSGGTRELAAERVGVSLASVYRIQRAAKAA